MNELYLCPAFLAIRRMARCVTVVWLASLWWVGLPWPAIAQISPATLPADLRLSIAGEVLAGALQADGKVVVAGRFTSINGVPRNGLARLNPNGSVDMTWNPPVSATFGPLVVNSAGVFVAGSFTNLDGTAYPEAIAKLSLESGALDAQWKPGLTNSLWEARAMVSDGSNLFAALRRVNWRESTQTRIVKISALGGGTVDEAWNPLPDGYVERNGLLLAGTNLFVAGGFTQIGGRPRQHLAKISTGGAGEADPDWNPGLDDTGLVSAITAMATDGTHLFVGGLFQSIGGRSRQCLAKLEMGGTGAVDPDWYPIVNPPAGPEGESVIRSLAVSGSHLYVGGGWFNSINSQGISNLARLSLAGSGVVDMGWNPELAAAELDLTRFEGNYARPDVEVLLASPAGLLVGGNFTFARGKLAMGMVRLDAVSAGRDPAFAVQVERAGAAHALALQSDGKLVVGGHFFLCQQVPRSCLLRLNADGTLDRSWFPEANGIVDSVVIRGTDIFVGGRFTRIGNQPRNRLAKLSSLSSDGVDPLWDPNASSSVRALVLQGNNLYVGGYFRTVGGLVRRGLAKVSPTGSGAVDPFWNPGESTDMGDGDTRVDALLAAGTNLVVGGCFFGPDPIAGLMKVSMDGLGTIDTNWLVRREDCFGVSTLALWRSNVVVGSHHGLFRIPLDGNGAADPLWPDWPHQVGAMALEGDALYVGGFSNEGEPYLVKMSAMDGRVDSTWNHPLRSQTSWKNPTYALLAKGEDIYAAGAYEDIGGQPRLGVAFLPVADAPLLAEGTNGALFIRRSDRDGTEVTHFRILELGNGVSLYQADGLTPVRAGDFISAEEGARGLRFQSAGVAGSFVKAASSLNDTPAGVGSAPTTRFLGSVQPPIFSLSNATYRVNEGVGVLTVQVRKNSTGAASVLLLTADGTAQGGRDYQVRSNRLSFADGESSKTLTIGIADDFETEGDENFFIQLLQPSGGALLAYPSLATVTIVDNDGVGSPDSLPEARPPNPRLPPPAGGVLAVDLQPAQAGGQWRLEGEFAWRDAGASVRGLVSGNYRIEFRPVNSFLAPPAQTVPVTSGVSNQQVFYYTPTGSPLSGELTVRVQPDDVATAVDPALRGQWRRQGETGWRDSGERIGGLAAGIHLIEFKPVPGRATPPAQSVVVAPDQNNVANGIYLYSTPAPGLAPTVLSFLEVTNQEPYLFNGQFQTDLGFGSGVVVKPRVVLTAAHVLFDEIGLTFVTRARWFFQKHKGDYDPIPQTPRGWYVFEGYAAQRARDNSPGVSTPASQQLDAAAVFFVESSNDPNFPGRGGYGGFLASDDLSNPWLMGSQRKMLAGYPIDQIAPENQGRLHATAPGPAAFVRSAGRVFATTDMKSYPGNSGGPLYVEFEDGRFYPAGIYLGGFSQTLVRAIDSEVVDLINRAELSGSNGGNNTGGGVGLWSPGFSLPAFVPGLFRVNFLPSAIADRAAWRVKGGTDPAWIGSSVSNLYYPLVPGAFNIEFKPLNGQVTPPVRRVELIANQITVVDVEYRPLRLDQFQRLADGSVRLTLDGGTGRVYTLQRSGDLITWSNRLTITNLTGRTNLVDSQASGQSRLYYRVMER